MKTLFRLASAFGFIVLTSAGAWAQDNAYGNAVAVTPSDVTRITATRALYVGSAGDIAVVMAGQGGSQVTFTNIPVGTTLQIAVVQVKSTGTTAVGIIALR